LKVLFILYVLIALFFFQSGCTEFEKEDQVEAVTDQPDQESWDNNIYFQRDGKRLAVLTAGYIAKYYQKKHTILKEGVKVDFYGEDGSLKSKLTAEDGKVFDDSQDMVATGNVIVRSTNGTTLYSEELHWENKEGKITSKVPVKITTESEILYGDSFRSDPDLVDYEITNARGTSEKTISIDD